VRLVSALGLARIARAAGSAPHRSAPLALSPEQAAVLPRFLLTGCEGVPRDAGRIYNGRAFIARSLPPLIDSSAAFAWCWLEYRIKKMTWAG